MCNSSCRFLGGGSGTPVFFNLRTGFACFVDNGKTLTPPPPSRSPVEKLNLYAATFRSAAAGEIYARTRSSAQRTPVLSDTGHRLLLLLASADPKFRNKENGNRDSAEPFHNTTSVRCRSGILGLP